MQPEQERQSMEVEECTEKLSELHLDDDQPKKHAAISSGVEKAAAGLAPDQALLQQHINACLARAYKWEELPVLASKLNGSVYDAHQGVIGIRKLVCKQEDITDKIEHLISIGIIPRLIQFTREWTYERLQSESTWILTNISSGTSVQCQSVVDQGGIPQFVALLSSTNHDVFQQAIWALGNIAGDCTANRNMIIQAGGVGKLVQIAMAFGNQKIVNLASWALSNLCRGSPQPNFQDVHTTIPVFLKAVVDVNFDQEILTDCCWALTRLLQKPRPEVEHIVLKSGAIERFVSFFTNPILQIRIPSIRNIGNLTLSADNSIIEEIMRQPIIKKSYALLSSKSKAVRKEVCWVLSNLVAHSPDSAMKIFANELLVKRLVQLLKTDAHQVTLEISMVFLNFCLQGSPSYVVRLGEEVQVVPTLLNLLKQPNEPNQLAAIKALSELVKAGSNIQAGAERTNPIAKYIINSPGRELIEALLLSQNENIYKKAFELMTGLSNDV